MSKIHSYSSIYNLGHPAVRDLTNGPVIVEEKIDGSQFSFGLYGDVPAEAGARCELRARSKGKELILDAPEKMFTKAVDTVRELQPLLRVGWTYRGEYLEKPKHNVLAYDRVPAKHIIIFDIEREDGTFLPPQQKWEEAHRLGLEIAPPFGIYGALKAESLRDLLEMTSVLGGQKIEGVVIKPVNYDQYGTDKKVLMGKYVSEAFKEVHAGEWKKNNPGGKDIVALIATELRTPARFQKAVQHLREAGQITDSPKDIGPLFKEVNADILKECSDDIKAKLLKWAWPQISRIVTSGLPDWYKQQLLEAQFAQSQNEATAHYDGVQRPGQVPSGRGRRA